MMVYLVHINGPRGEAHAVALREEQMEGPGFWQDFGECDGVRYASFEDAERAAATRQAEYDKQRWEWFVVE